MPRGGGQGQMSATDNLPTSCLPPSFRPSLITSQLLPSYYEIRFHQTKISRVMRRVGLHPLALFHFANDGIRFWKQSVLAEKRMWRYFGGDGMIFVEARFLALGLFHISDLFHLSTEVTHVKENIPIFSNPVSGRGSNSLIF
ncbi:hypothetical protein TNIN_316391 [Trichonephila inaurata madagascariensis]|uniref:Uncharacterized protein n=1 Tax=Trichonephila inaurata madagascariensis TaxID=2747483 RepID=A0A8X6K462_9ARAC|nr:hypothetical protein TNIN_316391 [Trichonephila inaurata madagascariensis]